VGRALDRPLWWTAQTCANIGGAHGNCPVLFVGLPGLNGLWRVSDLPPSLSAVVDCSDSIDSWAARDSGRILTVIQKSLLARAEKWASFPDMHGGERLAMAPVIG